MTHRLSLVLISVALLCLAPMARAQDNLVVNGQFDTNLSGWTLGPATSTWSSMDRGGSANSGSVQVVNSVRRNDQGPYQCFPTEGGTRIELGAWALLPVDASTDARAITVAVQYESEDCTDGPLLYTYSNRSWEPGEWADQGMTTTTLHGARSVGLFLAPYPNTNDPLTVTANYDDAYYREVAYGQFTLNPSLSASWYDPDQSGHGILLHLLDRYRVWMCWYTFNAAGDPAWICALGRTVPTINGLRFDDAFFVEGGRFPPDFDPALIEQVPWGSIEIDFSSCDEGVMRWTTEAAGFSSGSMPLRRVTTLWDNPCTYGGDAN